MDGSLIEDDENERASYSKASLLNAGEAHIWFLQTDKYLRYVSSFKNVLSSDEMTRAEDFHFERDKNNFIITRAVLRFILSEYLKVNAEDVSFEYEEKGKPSVLSEINSLKINFNLSHSKGVALYAFALDVRLGVDVEYKRSLSSLNDMAKKTLTEREFEEYSLMPISKKAECFFKFWTHKEAFVKATGEGVFAAMDLVEFTFNKENELNISYVRGSKEEASRWISFGIDCGAEYEGALLLPNDKWKIKRFDCYPRFTLK